MMYLMMPLSTGAGPATQLAGLRSLFCWRLHPVEGEGQETIVVLVVVSVMVKSGAPGIGTA